MYLTFILTAFLFLGCGSMSADSFHFKGIKSNEIKRIQQEYQKVKFDGNITKQEAEVIFNNYVITKGWPWKMAGGNTKPIDSDNYWLIKYMNDFGIINENEKKVLINKITGEISIH